MNLTLHAAPQMGCYPRYRHQVANIRKNSMERLTVTLEDYNDIDLVNIAIVRDSSGGHALNRMRGTARFVSIGVTKLPALIEALEQARAKAVEMGLSPGRPPTSRE